MDLTTSSRRKSLSAPDSRELVAYAPVDRTDPRVGRPRSNGSSEPDSMEPELPSTFSPPTTATNTNINPTGKDPVLSPPSRNFSIPSFASPNLSLSPISVESRRKLAGGSELHASVARRRERAPTGDRRPAVMGVPSDDAVLIQKPKKPGEPHVVTVNCPDKTGLGCDICRTILDFGLYITRGGKTNSRYVTLALCGVSSLSVLRIAWFASAEILFAAFEVAAARVRCCLYILCRDLTDSFLVI